MKLSPLFKPRCFSNGQKMKVTRKDAYGDQFWLRISEAQFDLVYGWAVLDRVGSQVFVSAILDQAPRKPPNPSVAHLHTLKLPAGSVLNPSGAGNQAHLLTPIFLILPLSTNSSSFCHVG